MDATIEVIAGVAYLATAHRACGGTGQTRDVTNLDNSTGTVSPDGTTTCPCRTGRTYRAMWSIEIEAHAENDRRDRVATETVGDMPDWMLG